MSRSKISLAIAIVLITIGLVAFLSRTNTDVQIDQLDLTTKQQRIDIAEEKAKVLEKEVEEAKGNKKLLDEAEKKLQEQEKLIQELQARKLEKQRIAQAEAQNAVQAAPETPTAQQPSGDWVAQCHAWAAQAGIVLTPSAIQLLERESHCNHLAQNPTSSACGIAQNIQGCGSAGYGYDPISQLIWFHNYCQSRYGGFDGALAHSLANNWY